MYGFPCCWRWCPFRTRRCSPDRSKVLSCLSGSSRESSISLAGERFSSTSCGVWDTTIVCSASYVSVKLQHRGFNPRCSERFKKMSGSNSISISEIPELEYLTAGFDYSDYCGECLSSVSAIDELQSFRREEFGQGAVVRSPWISAPLLLPDTNPDSVSKRWFPSPSVCWLVGSYVYFLSFSFSLACHRIHLWW